MNYSSYKPVYRSEIDGLRAFAVLSVVAFHAFPNYFKGGFIGVDVFLSSVAFLLLATYLSIWTKAILISSISLVAE